MNDVAMCVEGGKFVPSMHNNIRVPVSCVCLIVHRVCIDLMTSTQYTTPHHTICLVDCLAVYMKLVCVCVPEVHCRYVLYFIIIMREDRVDQIVFQFA
jgi:hypothetical protein